MRRHIYYTLQSLLHKQGSNAIKIVSLALGLLMSVFLFARIAFELSLWGIERSGFFNGREKWAKGFENQRV